MNAHIASFKRVHAQNLNHYPRSDSIPSLARLQTPSLFSVQGNAVELFPDVSEALKPASTYASASLSQELPLPERCGTLHFMCKSTPENVLQFQIFY